MTIQINTDDNISGDKRNEEYFTQQIEKELDRFSGHITRIEVHFSDENADKSGPQDKKCVLEARLKNKQPIAVTSKENTVEKSFHSALKKVTASIDTIIGRDRNH